MESVEDGGKIPFQSELQHSQLKVDILLAAGRISPPHSHLLEEVTHKRVSVGKRKNDKGNHGSCCGPHMTKTDVFKRCFCSVNRAFPQIYLWGYVLQHAKEFEYNVFISQLKIDPKNV